MNVQKLVCLSCKKELNKIETFCVECRRKYSVISFDDYLKRVLKKKSIGEK